MELTYRTHVLEKVQQLHECGGGATIIPLQQATFDALDIRAAGNDPSADSLRRRLVETVKQIEGPDDYVKWGAFYDAYGEAVFYLVAKERSVWLDVVPTKKGTKTPDFHARAHPECWFEVKTPNIKGGGAAHDGMLYDGIDANYAAQEEAKEEGVGFGVSVVAPHGEGATIFDATKQVIDKIRGMVKAEQFKLGPTYLVVCLDRVGIPATKKPLHQGSTESRLGNRLVSGDLWHVALGDMEDVFHYEDQLYPDVRHEPLRRQGVLREFDFVEGVIFVVPTWHKLAQQDGAFRHDAFKLFGVRRFTPKPQSNFDRLCDKLLVTEP